MTKQRKNAKKSVVVMVVVLAQIIALVPVSNTVERALAAQNCLPHPFLGMVTIDGVATNDVRITLMDLNNTSPALAATTSVGGFYQMESANLTTCAAAGDQIKLTASSGAASTSTTVAFNAAQAFTRVDLAIDSAPPVVDNTAPVITLNGAAVIELNVGSIYEELGATAIDDVDQAVTVVATGTVNTAIVGTYAITYSATDAANNTATTTRTIHVIPAPVATLSAIAITAPAAKLVYTVGDNLDISGLVVTGTYSDNSTRTEPVTLGNVTGFTSAVPAIGQVLTITIGDKTTTYAVDIVAAPAQPIAPALTAIAPQSVEEGANVTFTAVSNNPNEGNLTYSLSGTIPAGAHIDPATGLFTWTSGAGTAGVYSFDIVVTDGIYSASIVSTPLTITVVAPQPVAILTEIRIAPAAATILVGSTRQLNAATLDQFNAPIETTLTWTSSDEAIATVDSIGTVTAVATGTANITAASNTVSGMSVVTVIETPIQDTVAPVIVLNGSSTLDIIQGSTYVDLGATATDDIDPVVTVITENAIDPLTIGTYTVTYTATDAAGNTATPVIRTVNVTAAPTPTPTLSSIAITTPANKLVYAVGDQLDLMGLVVTGTYSDGSTKAEVITGANVTGFDSTAPTVGQVLTITVGTASASYTIDVMQTPVVMDTQIAKNGELNNGTATFTWSSINGIGSQDGTVSGSYTYYTDGVYLRFQVKDVSGQVVNFADVFQTGTALNDTVGGMTLQTNAGAVNDMDGSNRERADWGIAGLDAFKTNLPNAGKYVFYGLIQSATVGTKTVGFAAGDTRSVTMTLTPKSDLVPGVYTVTIETLQQGSSEPKGSIGYAFTIEDANALAVVGVTDQIAALPTPITLADANSVAAARSAYVALTPEQKALVTNLAVLESAETEVVRLQAEAAQAAVNDVIAQIDALPAALTLADATAVVAARNAFEALTAAQQALVTNLEALIVAETEIANLQAGTPEAADHAAAKVVIDMINALPTPITLADANSIAAARSAYAALTEARQALVTNLVTLAAAEGQIVFLENANIPDRIEIDPAIVAMEKGATTTVAVKVFDKNGNRMGQEPAMEWSSSDPLVAVIGSHDIITALAEGTTVITASIGTIRANTTITVTDQAPVVIEDTTAPVITLSGAVTINLTVGDAYIEQGATATDNVDANVTVVTTGTVNTAIAGTYTVTYTASDAATNAATPVIRTIIVSEAPAIPAIDPAAAAALATAKTTAAALTPANYMSFTAVTAALALPETTTAEVTAKTAAIDAAIGALVPVVVSNPDTIAPVIALNGASVINIALGGSYSDPGASAVDNIDGNITNKIVTTNPVNTLAAGVYTVTYAVHDTAGNAATIKSRTVNIINPSTGSGGGGGGGGGGSVTPSYIMPAETDKKSGSSTDDAAKIEDRPQVGSVLGVSRFVFNRDLRQGVRGDEVKELQDRLRGEGLFKIESTGFFGPMTADAVKKFQKKHGLAETGIINDATRELLNTKTVSGNDSKSGKVAGVNRPSDDVLRAQLAILQGKLLELLNQLMAQLQAKK